MKTRIHGLLFPLLVLPALAILLPGCSKTDDVRLVLCKEVTDRLLATMRPIEWLGDSHRIRRPEYAVIHLDFTVSKTGWEDRKVTSECYFAYDTVEENVMTHVDELSAYSTLPYKMTIRGREVPHRILQKAVNQEQIEGFAEFFEKIREAPRKLQAM